jgi:hypothetical protein
VVAEMGGASVRWWEEGKTGKGGVLSNYTGVAFLGCAAHRS